ncbi:amidohydrolase family protein [Candidatus Gottesmanbacteria bacterium]|nr:amidohydrolase family protein [Candidatus Gottesmanbacteria bacterium]
MSIQQFPGFIDIHVHLRQPGATQKEDFFTGSRAAVKGGFTCVLDMPNNPGDPTISLDKLEEKIQLARSARCDIGFYYGTDGNNLDSFPKAATEAYLFGLKLYMEDTTGELLVEDATKIAAIFAAWKSDKPILIHAEGEHIGVAFDLAQSYHRRIHVCHVASWEDLVLVRKAKEKGLSVTCGVTPHHLFLSQTDRTRLGSFAQVMPSIGDTSDQNALWEGVVDGTVDVVESDHAPHTMAEKHTNPPAFGVPGLETTLGLLLLAVHQKRISLETVVKLLYDGPRKIFSIPIQQKTYIELDPVKPFIAGALGYETKCAWSPFDGWELYGQVQTVVLRGKPVVQNAKVI